MLYTFEILRSPLKIVPGASSKYKHYFGGPATGLGIKAARRFARILTLDLRDPKLSFLHFGTRRELPLVMDFAEGVIDYSVRKNGVLVLHSRKETASDSLLERELPLHRARLESIPYEQYRAAIFAGRGPDVEFLSADDSAALEALGESYSQIGGSHARAATYCPYCANPKCDGYGKQVNQMLATISQTPALGVSLEFLPYDPAIEYSFCHTCHSISGVIVPD